LEHQLFNSCSDFPEALKKLLNDAPLFLQPDYLSALEKGGPAGLSFRYVGVKEKNRFIAFYNYQLVSLSSRSIHRIFYNQQYSKLLAKFSAKLTRYIFGVKEGHPHYLLVNGSVMISGPYYGWAGKGREEIVKAHLIPALKEVTMHLNAESKLIATVIKDFDQSSSFRPQSGFSKVMMDPVMEFSIASAWKSFDDYLSSLSAKYRLRFNNAQKKFSDVKIKYLSKNEIEQEREAINTLYQNVQQKAPIRLVQPDAGYLAAVHQMQHPQAFLKAFYLHDKMIMFMCGVCNDGHLEAHHIGMDYSFNRSHQLYLNMLYAYIGEGIERGATKISFGRTALEIKSTVGAVPVYLNAWLRMGNPLINKLLKPFIPSEPAADWVQRNPFKESDRD
jgi:hypothetical protein